MIVCRASLCLTVLALGSIAHGETEGPRLPRAELAAALAKQGLLAELPADAEGDHERVFGTRFLRVHSHGAIVYLGRAEDPAKAACTIPALEAAARDERGFRKILRRGPLPLVAYSLKDKGRSTYNVQGCVLPSRTVCGGADLVDTKAVEVVWKLCSSVRDLPAQSADPQDRVGVYATAFFVDDSAGDRAAGHGGSGKRVRATITIRRTGDRYTARYAVGLPDDKNPAANADLSEVRIDGETFSAAPIYVKAAWPYYLPRSFDGRFIAAGVLLVDGKQYQR